MGAQLKLWRAILQFLQRGYARVKKMALSSARTLVPKKHTLQTLSKTLYLSYYHKIEAVQEFTRTLPALVWHRQDWTILHLYLHLNADELEALQMCIGYVARFVDLEVDQTSKTCL